MTLARALVVVVGLLASSAQGQELVGESREGSRKTCAYRSPAVGAATRTVSVSEAEPCSATRPLFDPNMPAPPYASLDYVTDNQGSRLCTYVEGAGQWTYRIPIGAYCPPNVGSLPKNSVPLRDRLAE